MTGIKEEQNRNMNTGLTIPGNGSFEIRRISPRYHLCNPPKIIKASVSGKTLQFDECRVGDFILEIWWILPWNLVDFTHEIQWISPRFHLWNPPKIIKASVSAKTLQFDECRLGLWPRISWNPLDFTWNLHEIRQISWIMSFRVMIKYRSFDFRKTNKR